MCSRGPGYGDFFGPACYGAYGDYFGNDPGLYAIAVNYSKLQSGSVFSCILLAVSVFRLWEYIGNLWHVIGNYFTVFYGSYLVYAAGGICAGISSRARPRERRCHYIDGSVLIHSAAPIAEEGAEDRAAHLQQDAGEQ